MGTPEFAVASLETLVTAGYDIAAVVTAPDKPAGRGYLLQESAVKQFARKHELNLLQPEKLKNPAFLETLKDLHVDLQVVVAFRMLPEVVWNMPPLGTINLHGSLLPQYRGAAPINWAIINGEKETGITTFRLQHEIDTGAILLQEKITIDNHQTAGELHDVMKVKGANLLLRTVQQFTDRNFTETPQAFLEESSTGVGAQLRHAPKINAETCKIDWSDTVENIHNRIRGLSPFPGAFTHFNNKLLKILRSEVDLRPITDSAGTFQSDQKTFLRFAGKNGYIILKEVQLEGKRKMKIEEFLRGYRFE